MAQRVELGDVSVDVVFKDIKNVHLSVYPPTGRVTVSAPSGMSLDTVRVYAISKLDWIRQQQKKLHAQPRETPREYVDRESHYVWDKRYLLKIVKADAAAGVDLEHSRIVLRVRPGTDACKRQAIIDEWYRTQLKQAVVPLIKKWEPMLGVTVSRFFVQRMKTKRGQL